MVNAMLAFLEKIKTEKERRKKTTNKLRGLALNFGNKWRSLSRKEEKSIKNLFPS
jgi:hypothetical protein